MADKSERTKTIKFNLDNPEEKELWEALQSLRHGFFSERSKRFWKEHFKKEEKK